MKNKTKFILPLIACVLSLASCNGGGGDPHKSSGTPHPTTSHNPDDFDGYYRGYDIDNVGQSELQFNLHRLCLDKHTKVVKYSQYSSFNSRSTSPRPIDQDPNNPENIIFFYTGKSQKVTQGGWNREHVWPCANSSGLWVHNNYTSREYYVDDSNYWGGGSDLFNVRPCSSYVNTARGNSKYIEFSETDVTYLATDSGAPYALKVNADPKQGFATKCEPADEVKGDIVRSIMYTYIHYNKYGSYNWYYDEKQTKCVMGTLQLNNVFGYDSMEKIYQVMSRWNALDPVDDLERLRNNTIQAIQGNRNPFVDYPDLLDRCLGVDTIAE